MSRKTHERIVPTTNFFSEINRRIQNDEELKQFPIVQVNIISGGVSHYVFELILSDGKKMYLKKRAAHFAQLPQIKSNPKDIRYERLILNLFYSLSSDNFPEVITYNTDGNYIVLSDAMPDVDSGRLEDLFLEGQVTEEMILSLGRTLAKIHSLSSSHTTPIREPNDDEHYKLKLQHRLGYRNHPVLNKAIKQLTLLPRKQLILGDVAPKNIAVNNSGRNIKFFDMEEAHLGDPLFDYAYMLGHIIVHNLNNKKLLIDQINAYQQGYFENNYNKTLVKVIALGIVLYRLNSIVPYSLSIKQNLRKKFESQILRKTLYQNIENMSWEEIIESMHL